MDNEHLNEISLAVVQCAIEVHRILGPGLLESVYQVCLCYELRERGMGVVTEQVLPISYKNVVFDVGYQIDLLVEDSIIVELKSIETVLLRAPALNNKKRSSLLTRLARDNAFSYAAAFVDAAKPLLCVASRPASVPQQLPAARARIQRAPDHCHEARARSGLQERRCDE